MSNKPVVEKLVEEPEQSFLFRKIIREKRPDHRIAGVWHFHPDYEITLTVKSSGKRFVGFSINDYFPNELVLLGENLPHCWITNEHTEQYVINFKKDLLGLAFGNFPEFDRINNLLEKSNRGILFNRETTFTATKIIAKFNKLNHFNRLLLLFKLLNLLALSQNKVFITFQDYRIKDSLKASNRIEKIYSYIHSNYNSGHASITALSDQLYMTTSSLCKFIKMITKKTFTELLIETRVNEACKLLSVTDKYISEICYLCGFKNVSNFNRAFKKVMNVTPREYRKLYREVN